MSSRMSATIFSSRSWLDKTPLHRPPFLLQLRLGDVIQSLRLGIETLVDFGLVGQLLVGIRAS